MKTYTSFLVIALLMINALNGQVKIGDSPENLHNASVLELESTSRVLVITRVTDAQMNLISPLRGAVVYNTDHDCLHYYDGNAWINICEALDNSFTVSTRADYMKPLNPNALDNTVIVTETTNPDGSSNYNFEVSQITGANIAPSAINGDKIQNGTVGSQDLAPKSVALGHFQDGGAIGDLFRWNGSQWVLSNESEIRITEKDSIIGNEVVNATIGGSLERNGVGNNADPYTLDVRNGGIGPDELADDAITNSKMADNSVGTNELTDDAVTTDKITDANVTLAKLADGNTAGELMQWNGTAWTLVDDSSLTITEVDGIVGNEVVDATDGTLTRTGDGTNVPYTLGVSTGGISDNELANNSVTTDKITDANVTLAKLANGTAAGQLMQWNGTAWTLVDDSSLTITEVDGIVGNEVVDATDGTLTRTGDGTNVPYTLGVSTNGITDNELANNSVTTDKITDANVTLAKLADGTAAGQLMQWDGNNWVLVDDSVLDVTEDDGIVGNEVVDATDGTLTRTGNGTNVPYTLGVSTNGITDNELNNGAVTTDKIADADVTPAKIEPSGTEGQILTTIGGNVSWQSPAVVAMGKVDATATIVNSNGAFVVQNGIGDYTVTLNTALPTADYIVQLTLQNTGGSFTIEVTNQTATTFDVRIWELSAPSLPGALTSTPTNAQWFFTVTNF